MSTEGSKEYVIFLEFLLNFFSLYARKVHVHRICSLPIDSLVRGIQNILAKETNLFC
jgi:hypothetical protein